MQTGMKEDRLRPTRRTRVLTGMVLGAIAVVLIALAGTMDRQSLIALRTSMDPTFWGVEQSTEPTLASKDFSVQGEYAAPGAAWAVQVVARGDGRFEALGLPGGLPGAGWTGETPIALQGETRDGVILFDGDARARIEAGELRLTLDDGGTQTLSRIERKSPTLGALAPPGATILFDNARNNAFDGRVDAAGHLESGARSLAPFGDFRLHLEFRTPFAPQLPKQKRGNSGVYIQGRYEVQILDSFGRLPQSDGAGALYKQRAPNWNLSLPPLQWQTYDIDFRAARFDAQGKRREKARISVRHNGVLVHDDVELEGPTGAGQAEAPDEAPLFLQDHGNPVRFRNIWIESLTEN